MNDIGEVGIALILRLLALACFIVVALLGFDVITSTYALGWFGLGSAAYVLSELVP